MASKYLEASGAFATSGDNARVYKVSFGATDAGTIALKTGGSGGTIVALYHAKEHSIQVTVPGMVADYATLTGTNPDAVIEFHPDKS